METKIKFVCECLIDQYRYIGSDPVGHACGNEASHETVDAHGRKFCICSTCAFMMIDQPERIQTPLIPNGIEGQTRLMQMIADDMLSRLSRSKFSGL